MNIQKLEFEDTNAFKDLFLDYINGEKTLAPFYGNFPDLNGFKNQINERIFSQEIRDILVKVLNEQYSSIVETDQVKKSIELLKKPNTFTITTGHQLNIFTGPLYFIFKIITVINLCEKLKMEFPDKNFVPIYWMASEDHDFEEIRSFNLFGKNYQWETDQTGAVGRFSPKGVKTILDELPEKISLFERAYLESETLSHATRKVVNELFGKYGLVALDADEKELKSLFKEVILDDLHNHKANDLAGKAAEKLNQLGYSSQVYPRSINFFYLDNGLRERIVKDSDNFIIRNTDKHFNTDEINQLVSDTPEKFSPNVVLRPLFQEMILPNLAYIGGPSEIAYWVQLKSIFETYQVPFPILAPRNYALVLSKSIRQKIDKLGLKAKELFLDFQDLKLIYVARNAENELSINAEIKGVLSNFESLRNKAVKIDKSLDGFIASEAKKTQNNLENIAKRIRKAEEKKLETEISQLENIKSKLFPNNVLQERHDNFLNFYINDPHFIDDLKNAFDPLDFKFNVLSYDE